MSELPLPLRAVLPTLGPRVVTADLDGRTVVRCPGRPDYHDGNALLLHEPLTVASLDTVLDDWSSRFGTVPGIEQRVLRWAETDERDAAALDAALRARGLLLRWTTHLELERLPEAVAGVDGLELVFPGDPKRWHGVTVQFRHSGWSDDDAFWEWWVDGLRVLNDQGRALTSLAYRWGVPVGTATVHWDPVVDVGPDHAGLAVVDDVVVHPAHRRSGVASRLVHELVGRILADKPRARVVLRTDDAQPLYERLGFRARATLGKATSATAD